MEKNLQPLSVKDLSFLESGQLIEQTLTDFASVAPRPTDMAARAAAAAASFADPTLNLLVNQLTQKSEIFTESLKKVRKDDQTVAVVAADQERDKAYRVLSRAVGIAILTDNADELEAARSLKNLMDTYQGLQKLNFEAETKAIDTLLLKLNSDEYTPKITLLGFARMVNRLAQANAAFVEVFSSRLQDASLSVKYDNKILRAELLDLYSKMVSYIEIMVNINPTDEFVELLKLANGSRKYFADLLARRRGESVPAPSESTDTTVN